MPYISASTKPGITPAISRSPTSVRPSGASSTVSADGGMMTARPPTPMIGPIDRYLLYPRRYISGTMSEPSSAQEPMLESAGSANAVPARRVEGPHVLLVVHKVFHGDDAAVPGEDAAGDDAEHADNETQPRLLAPR